MEYEVGKEYEIKKENGKIVKRKCVGVVDRKYLEERDKLKAQYGFAPMFLTNDGYVFLSLSPPSRKKLSEEEKARRQKEKELRRKRFVERVRKNLEKKMKELEEKMKKYE